MAKITYYLGAGASFYACPILEKQAKLMIEVARFELYRNNYFKNVDGYELEITFKENEKTKIVDDNKALIIWHIGYFGNKALEYNTIDTYARKLFLNNEKELNLLKMSVSVFFDLWENFYEVRYKENYTNYRTRKNTLKNILEETNDEILSTEVFKRIDDRYKLLFSILIDKDNNDKIFFNKDFKFITWNYDLQLEETFNLFLNDNYQKDLNSLNNIFKYKYNNSEINDVFHLNGYRGFTSRDDKSEIILKEKSSIDEYWQSIDGFYDATRRNRISFNNHIKYAWEHNLENNTFFNNIYKVLEETEILIIIGYSFPAFNRKIDQLLFSKLDSKKIKKIVYQDPNASTQLIENLFEISTDSKDLKQFYLPNEHFITQTKIKPFTGL
jgi:hypothetical protein